MTSKQPRKQRKTMYTLPLHRRRKKLSAKLSTEMRKKYGVKSIMVRKGDKVRIVRGSHRKKEGNVTGVRLKNGKITVEKVTMKKADGTEIPVPIDCSNVIVIEVDTSDRRRKIRRR